MNPPGNQVSLRPVTLDDCKMVFGWRNDPFILTHGSQNREVSWDEHERWFQETVVERRRKMFIVLYQDTPIGQLRFDRERQQDCVISVYLLKAYTGQGLGVQAIRAGCVAIFEAWEVDRVIACVRTDNPSGRAAFLKAGFAEKEVGICPIKHHSLIFPRTSEAS